MEPIWFVLVSAMIVTYVVLDGFDLGAGALHLLIAKTDAERRTVLRTIGPVWDGNEVWLVAGGGTLYFAFPLLYASAFSGFYLPLHIVLWLLILRGIGIELRTHLDNNVWSGLFDGFFALSSLLLIVFFGAALGNVVRGVPLDANHTFFEALWTNFQPGSNAGILDWYTVSTGVLALVALTTHGALWIALKTEGIVHDRASKLTHYLVPVLVLLTAFGVPVTTAVRPQTLRNYSAHPIAYFIPVLVAVSLLAMWRFNSKGRERAAFRASCCYLIVMLLGAAAALYPTLLPSSSDAANDITIYNAATGHYALTVGLVWWGFGIALAIGYFVFLYRMFGGKVMGVASDKPDNLGT